MPRMLNDWLTGFLSYADNIESPRSYIVWSGIFALCAALERRCYLRQGHRRVYPNEYIILVGPSGKVRKGEVLGLLYPILNEAEVRLIPERITKEALFKRMDQDTEGSDLWSQFKDEDDALKVQTCVTVLSPELSVFLGQKDTAFLSVLTDWWDCPPSWTNATKNKGSHSAENLCFNLLGATAPDWIPSMLSEEAVGGGFTSRCLFIVEQSKGKILPDPNSVKIESKLYGALVHDLKEIRKLVGQFGVTSEAREFYHAWYLKYETDLQDRNISPVADPKFGGYVARRATHARKIAMALSASRSDELLITLDDLQRAIRLMELAEKKMPRAFGGVGRARYTDAVEIIMDHLHKRGAASQSELLNLFGKDIDLYMLDQIEKLLVGMKRIRVTINTQTQDRVYVYNPEAETDPFRTSPLAAEPQVSTHDENPQTKSQVSDASSSE